MINSTRINHSQILEAFKFVEKGPPPNPIKLSSCFPLVVARSLGSPLGPAKVVVDPFPCFSPLSPVGFLTFEISRISSFDLVASLFPDTPEAAEARATAGRLREAVVLDSAGPTYQGRDLVQRIQEQLARLDCMTGEGDGAFEAATIEGLRRASQLSDERYLWYRPTMAALRALKKIGVDDGCGRQKVVAAPRCLRVNNEDFCP